MLYFESKYQVLSFFRGKIKYVALQVRKMLRIFLTDDALSSKVLQNRLEKYFVLSSLTIRFLSKTSNYVADCLRQSNRQIPICRIERKENVVDSVLCKGSKKYLFYNAFRHTIQSATKNKL